MAACSGTTPQPVISNTGEPAPPADADVIAKDPPDMTHSHGCEPILRCGMWSGCVWLEHTEPGRYQARGEQFVRRPYCAEDASGKLVCAEHCIGETCYEGLHPVDETCTGAGFPSRSTAVCNLGDGVCMSLM
jgi:hypothetical protein